MLSYQSINDNKITIVLLFNNIIIMSDNDDLKN